MLSRAVWTVVLALVAWIPSGRGGAWTVRGDRADRVIHSVSALEIAAESPARIASAVDAQINSASSKRPEPSRTLLPLAEAPSIFFWSLAAGGQAGIRRDRLASRAF